MRVVLPRPQSDDGFAPPSLTAGNVALRPIKASDFEFLQLMETTGELASRWRFHGSTPSPAGWAEKTWAGVLAQYLVFTGAATADGPSGAPIGVVCAYDARFEHGHAMLAAARFGERRSPELVVGLALLIRHVLTCWNLRKLYISVPEFNLDQFSKSVKPYFAEEGRLIDHVYYGGRYWDEVTLALYREQWAEVEPRLLRAGGA